MRVGSLVRKSKDCWDAGRLGIIVGYRDYRVMRVRWLDGHAYEVHSHMLEVICD